jgi:hypothetical protein
MSTQFHTCQPGWHIRCNMDEPGLQFRQGQENFSLQRNVHTGPGAHPMSYSVSTGVLSWGLKRPQRKVNHPVA